METVRAESTITQYKNYAKAPITEAIIDIRVVLPEKIKLKDLTAVYQGKESLYPKIKETINVQGQFTAGAGMGVGATATQKQMGYWYLSQDEKQLFQVRLDGFTMNRFEPYIGWEAFSDEAKRLWKSYREILTPNSITRLAVRYINRLHFPLPTDFKDYLRTYPEISSDLPQDLGSYVMQTVTSFEKEKVIFVLTEALVEPIVPETASVILDIDLFRAQEVPNDEIEIWKFFEELRHLKNSIFEGCITDETRRLIDAKG